MARRNKKRTEKNDAGFLPLVVGFAAVVLLFGLTYVRLCSQCESLGRDLKALENQKLESENQRQIEQYKWNVLKSPLRVEQALERQKMAMAWERRDQVFKLAESPTDLLAMKQVEDDSMRLAMMGRTTLNE